MTLRLPTAMFPPQARGCTVVPPVIQVRQQVSPAGAGMHPPQWRVDRLFESFPRRRGDAPRVRFGRTGGAPFPPQARGCTSLRPGSTRARNVSPAGAGMHPRLWASTERGICFPRRRGDAPGDSRARPRPVPFPPQARGCTDAGRHPRDGGPVSPAGAGMHRLHGGCPAGDGRFPRRRGDAPRRAEVRLRKRAFPPQARGCTRAIRDALTRRAVSPAGAGMHPPPPRRGSRVSRFPPQARGCTAERHRHVQSQDVSPAGAGMHRAKFSPTPPWPCFPRRRGDAPQRRILDFRVLRFPPQARGCTLVAARPGGDADVSPAGAGMHLFLTGQSRLTVRFPRRRGDAPFLRPTSAPPELFPPQARGCTAKKFIPGELDPVSPAGAGMHRTDRSSAGSESGFPRRRGDAPFLRNQSLAVSRFPPQARGCTDADSPLMLTDSVSPAGAGMHPDEDRGDRERDGFPRRRGDAPYAAAATTGSARFPPQARGCTASMPG